MLFAKQCDSKAPLKEQSIFIFRLVPQIVPSAPKSKRLRSVPRKKSQADPSPDVYSRVRRRGTAQI